MSVGCQDDSETTPDGGTGTDGSTPDGSVDGGGSADCTPQESGVLPDGNHVARYDYMQGNLGCRAVQCHNGTNGPAFTVAGAVYDRRETGGNPVGGAHVYVVDSGGREFHAVTASNGFFWFQDAVSPPLRASVSLCPDRIEMVAFANGNCNASGACHVETNKIYVNSAP